MDKKVLRWNFVFQYGWVITNLVNSMLLLPVYVHKIDGATLGVWLATGSILAWMTLVDPGVGEVLQQRIAEACGAGKLVEAARAIGSGIMASGIMLVLAVLVGLVCYLFIGTIIDKDISRYPHLQTALVLSVFATGLSLASFSLSGIHQGIHNAVPVAVASLSTNVLFLLVNLMLLLLGFGVLSIALANLIKNLYLNGYLLVSLRNALRRKELAVVWDRGHFRRFVRIFCYTSAGKIVSGLAYSVDMIVLARFIPPGMITVYEINKRPVNMTNNLIARHSVALMPSISHAVGSGDRPAILRLVERQFRFYSYAALFTCVLFVLVYGDLITAWAGKGQYAGNTICVLLVLYSFVGLICYYMSNVGYALGDIKANSLFNLIRNFCYGVLLFFAARWYGIIGTLSVSIALALGADLFFFSYRVYRLGYLRRGLVKSTMVQWLLLLPTAVVCGLGVRQAAATLLPSGAIVARMMVVAVLFTGIYAMLLAIADRELRALWHSARSRIKVQYLRYFLNQ